MSEPRPRFSEQTLTRSRIAVRGVVGMWEKTRAKIVRVSWVSARALKWGGQPEITSVIREGQIFSLRQAVVVESAAFQKRATSVMMVRKGGRDTTCTAVVESFRIRRFFLFRWLCVLPLLFFCIGLQHVEDHQLPFPFIQVVFSPILSWKQTVKARCGLPSIWICFLKFFLVGKIF